MQSPCSLEGEVGETASFWFNYKFGVLQRQIASDSAGSYLAPFMADLNDAFSQW